MLIFVVLSLSFSTLATMFSVKTVTESIAFATLLPSLQALALLYPIAVLAEFGKFYASENAKSVVFVISGYGIIICGLAVVLVTFARAFFRSEAAAWTKKKRLAEVV